MTDSELLNLHVALLSGGWSDEREISLASGDYVEKALAEAGFTHVDRLDIAEPDFLQRIAAGKYDVAFIAMHGHGGEDGVVQGFFETLRIPYTFSGVEASAISVDKKLSKEMYRTAGIPVAADVLLTRSDWEQDRYDLSAIIAECGLPAFVKPATNGSSIGISKVLRAEYLPAAIEEAFKHDDKILVERCIEGTEITVPVIGNSEPRALPIVEVVPGEGAEFYDLTVKYEPPEEHHIIPARLPEEVYAFAQQLAIEAHKVLGCKGASRSDFIVTEDGMPFILETNNIPGMTETSLVPDCAARDGIPFPQLCRLFIEYALEK